VQRTSPLRSSRQDGQKKTYMERPIWGPDEGVMPPRKYLSGLPVLPVRDRNFRWLAEEGAVLRENKLPEVPVGVYSESDF
jgi:hypothetical protein